MDVREVGWGDIEWIQLARDRDRSQFLVSAVNLQAQAPQS
jgi:hypothetical protein